MEMKVSKKISTAKKQRKFIKEREVIFEQTLNFKNLLI